ncbi:hypothetical protein AB0J48_32920 [Nocardia salmonicida]|uniref:hypothetical protein n=1 Tax=Nocardia salmonicida TaxID=53431 RepID=UPI003432CBC9
MLSSAPAVVASVLAVGLWPLLILVLAVVVVTIVALVRADPRDILTIVNCHREWASGRTEVGSMDLGRGNIALAVGRDEIVARGSSLSPADYRLIPGAPAAAEMEPLGDLCEFKAGPSNDIVKTLDIVDDGVALIAPAQLRYRRVAADHVRRVSHVDAHRQACIPR